MKRRTGHSIPFNHELHRHAFKHALTVLPKGTDRKHRGNTIRFESALQLEHDGQEIIAAISMSNGFRMSLFKPEQLQKTWQPSALTPHRIPKDAKPELILHSPHRLLKPRLIKYRAILSDWQKTTDNPLSFRHFNLLLVAISFDVTANL